MGFPFQVRMFILTDKRCSSFTKLLHQLSPSLFDGFQATLDLFDLLVEVGQFVLELFPVQPIFAALFPDEGLDFVPQ